jgi:hypothetical protein
MIRLTLAVVGVSLALAAAAQEPGAAKAVAPRAEDVSTIDGMIRAWYEIVSGPAGQPRDWARDRTLYVPDVRFFQVEVDREGRSRVIAETHAQFVERSLPLARDGFFEKEIHRVTRRFGPIAHVWSTYETRRTADGPVASRGINSIELFWDGKRWWISSATWSTENAANPIPPEYLPASR